MYSIILIYLPTRATGRHNGSEGKCLNIRPNKKVQLRILEKCKLKEKGENASISLLPNKIMPLLSKAHEIDDKLINEHQRYFNTYRRLNFQSE